MCWTPSRQGMHIASHLVLHCLPSLWFSVRKFLQIGVEGVIQPQHLGTLWWEVGLLSCRCNCAWLLEMLLCGSWRHVWCWIEHHMSSDLGTPVGPIHIEYIKRLEMPACVKRTDGKGGEPGRRPLLWGQLYCLLECRWQWVAQGCWCLLLFLSAMLFSFNFQLFLHYVALYVWLHTTVLAHGNTKKLHHPRTVLYRVVTRLTNSTYRIQILHSLCKC